MSEEARKLLAATIEHQEQVLKQLHALQAATDPDIEKRVLRDTIADRDKTIARLERQLGAVQVHEVALDDLGDEVQV